MIGGFIGFVVLAGLGLWLARRLSQPSSEEKRAQAIERAEATRSLLRRMQSLAQSALTLVAAEQPGFSKLGGEPDLPGSMEWPRAGGQPLAFLAQLDLREVRSADGPEWLPSDGRLWAFNDDQGYGAADHVHILYAPPDAVVARLASPADLKKRLRYRERPVEFRRTIVAPSLEWLGVDPRDLSIEGLSPEELASAPEGPHRAEPQHRIGGYPSEIQDERMQITAERLARGLMRDSEITPAIERAAGEWRLLLQIDSDPQLGMSFGDAGRLYVFIKEKHARVGDFSKTVSNWQTY